MIHEDGSIQISVGNKIKTLKDLDKIDLNSLKVNSFFCLLKSFRFCEGVDAKLTSKENKENIILQTNAHHNCTAYSPQCIKVLPLNSKRETITCHHCKSMRHKDSDEPELPIEKPPFPPPPPPSLPPPSSAINSILNTPTEIVNYLKQVAPYLVEGQLALIKSQLMNSSVSSVKSRKWDFDIMQLALSIWTRSPRAYEQLCFSKKLILPCVNTLSKYKNSVYQTPGVNDTMLQWMFMQAKNDNIPHEGYYGGLILYEMAIQEDIQIKRHGGSSKFVGMPDLGDEGNQLQSSKYQMANHVIQFMFHGLTGFRFLVAHYPTTQANAPQIYTMFWDVVQALEQWGFHVIYTSLDGASNNRSFINMHFPSPSSDMAGFNPFCDAHPVVFIADPSHLFKKIRNNILSSGTCKWHTRLLKIDGCVTTWKTFIDAYDWDKKHGLSIHQKLTSQHLHPNQAEKMRNHLAEECLNSDMLHLMKQFKESLCENSSAASLCDGPIKLLEQTSRLIAIFHDRRPIADLKDERLEHLSSALLFFLQWEKDTSDVKNLMSHETREDLKVLLYGFQKLCTIVVNDINYILTPGFINSDIVENIFSQQRGLHHGAGSNPNYQQYCTATNSITLCQNLVSKKSNAARRKSNTHGGSALPFKQLCNNLNIKQNQ